MNCISKRGYFISFGNASGLVEPFNPMLLARKGSIFFTRPSLMDYCSTRKELKDSSQNLFEYFRNGLQINIDSRLPLHEVKAAHEILENRLTKGSTVLIPTN